MRNKDPCVYFICVCVCGWMRRQVVGGKWWRLRRCSGLPVSHGGGTRVQHTQTQPVCRRCRRRCRRILRANPNPIVVVRARGGVDRRRRRSSGKTHRSGEIHTAAVRGRTRAAYLYGFFFVAKRLAVVLQVQCL